MKQCQWRGAEVSSVGCSQIQALTDAGITKYFANKPSYICWKTCSLEASKHFEQQREHVLQFAFVTLVWLSLRDVLKQRTVENWKLTLKCLHKPLQTTLAIYKKNATKRLLSQMDTLPVLTVQPKFFSYQWPLWVGVVTMSIFKLNSTALPSQSSNTISWKQWKVSSPQHLWPTPMEIMLEFVEGASQRFISTFG